jgi:hypothetical protein
LLGVRGQHWEKEVKKLNQKQFMAEKKVGLIVRGFARNPEDVPSRVAMMDELIRNARTAVVDGKPFIRRIDILVWDNRADFPNEADCGLLADALKEHFRGMGDVFVHNVTTGDLFCTILNYGIAMQIRAGCDYSVIASAEANAYWNSDVPEKFVHAVCSGACVTGVALNELTQSVLEGRIANTLAMWHNVSLMMVSGFDPQASKPKDDKHAHYMKGTDQNGDVRFYHLGGVEEMIPLARLIDVFGRCIAPIESDDPSLRYIQRPSALGAAHE